MVEWQWIKGLVDGRTTQNHNIPLVTYVDKNSYASTMVNVFASFGFEDYVA